MPASFLIAALNAWPFSNVAVAVTAGAIIGAFNIGAEEGEADGSAVGSALASGVDVASGSVVSSGSFVEGVAVDGAGVCVGAALGSAVTVGVADGVAEASAVALGLEGVCLPVLSGAAVLLLVCCTVGSSVGRITVPPPMIRQCLPHEAGWCSE